MSNTEKDKQQSGQKPEQQEAGQKPEKIVTKYDRKMQRRKEEKEKELRNKRIGTIAGIAVVAVLVCIVASFPIRTWMTLNETYIEVNGEKITRVEYDYNYHIVSSNFINQYYTMYLYYFGIDLTSDLSNQMYSDTLTWKDHFDEMTVAHLAQSKSLLKEAKEAGFTYDSGKEYDDYMASLKETAEEAGTSVKDYIRQLYGSYATESRVKPYVQEAMYLLAYNEVLEERFMPSQEEIQEYYDSNADTYDSVDYYVYTVNAELPTEPTELADPADETEEDGEDAGGEEDEETPYQPSEAEIEAAMKMAKKKADAEVSKVKTSGEQVSNAKKSGITYLLQEWLFDKERKAGDTTVIEDSSNHRYYVLEFENRYLDHALSVDARVIMTKESDGQAILDEWKGGDATEESFAVLYDKYRDASLAEVEGGLYEDMTASGVPAALQDWLFDSTRTKGDTTVISPEDTEYTYVVYYVGTGEEEWILNIRNLLLSQREQEYLDELSANADIRDPKKNLNYLKVQEEQAAGSGSGEEDSGNESSGESQEDSGSESSEDSQEDSGSESSGEN